MSVYDYGTCDKCGGKKKAHYIIFCPKCDKPADMQTRVLDYFKVAHYIAAQEGYDDKWYHRVLDKINFPGNDCGVTHFVSIHPDYPNEVMDQFNEGLIKYFGFRGESEDYEGDEVMLWISW